MTDQPNPAGQNGGEAKPQTPFDENTKAIWNYITMAVCHFMYEHNVESVNIVRCNYRLTSEFKTANTVMADNAETKEPQ